MFSVFRLSAVWLPNTDYRTTYFPWILDLLQETSTESIHHTILPGRERVNRSSGSRKRINLLIKRLTRNCCCQLGSWKPCFTRLISDPRHAYLPISPAVKSGQPRELVLQRYDILFEIWSSQVEVLGSRVKGQRLRVKGQGSRALIFGQYIFQIISYPFRNNTCKLSRWLSDIYFK